MKVIADNGLCQGHGQCAQVDEQVFTLDSDGYIAIGQGIYLLPDQEGRARQAVDLCPTGALSLE